MRLARCLFALLAVLLVCGFQITAPEDERANLFRWFDSLGFSQFKDGQFVEVKYWEEWSGKGKREYGRSDFGFLAKGSGRTFTVQTLGLSLLEVVDGKVSQDYPESASGSAVPCRSSGPRAGSGAPGRLSIDEFKGDDLVTRHWVAGAPRPDRISERARPYGNQQEAVGGACSGVGGYRSPRGIPAYARGLQAVYDAA
ncbi:MAG: hypothetical protein ACHQ50_07010 [Fimbriimonadales bacterium]